MLALLDFLSGIFALGILVFTSAIGIFFIYKSRKLKLNLLLIAAFMIIFTGFLYLGVIADFITVLITRINFNNSTGLEGILSYFSVPFAVIFAISIGAELLLPTKKRYILIIYLILGIFFEIVLLTDPLGSVKYILPAIPGENLIDSQFNYSAPLFYIISFFLLSVLLFNGIGFLYKSVQSATEIKKRFRLLAIGFILFVICAVFDALLAPGVILLFARVGVILTTIFFYYGLKTT